MSTVNSDPLIACNLDALSPGERARRSELARAIQRCALALEETGSGVRVRLPADADVHRNALELILLERRCCPFFEFELVFEPGDGAAVIGIGGGAGVKEFLRESGVFGCGSLAAESACC
jgi:hypothetical protein